MAGLVADLRVVDADSHMTEVHDLFTSRAPKGYEHRVPHVEKIDGVDMWVVEGNTFGRAGSGGTVDHDGKKHPHRKGNIGFHHYAFELSKRADVDEFYQALKRYDVEVPDPPDDYYAGGYYAVYFLDPDGLRMEAMVFDPVRSPLK